MDVNGLIVFVVKIFCFNIFLILCTDPSISIFLYRNNSRSYYKTIEKNSFNKIREICLIMGGDLAMVGIQDNNTRR